MCRSFVYTLLGILTLYSLANTAKKCFVTHIIIRCLKIQSLIIVQRFNFSCTLNDFRLQYYVNYINRMKMGDGDYTLRGTAQCLVLSLITYACVYSEKDPTVARTMLVQELENGFLIAAEQPASRLGERLGFQYNLSLFLLNLVKS